MARRVISKTFNGEPFKLIQAFPTREMAKSFAAGFRKHAPFGQQVKVRVTLERGIDPYKVWARGK
ncbi:MAG: hypothetical protein ACUZ8A_06470 [Candidatus Bathyanammoxibius sp.]